VTNKLALYAAAIVFAVAVFVILRRLCR